MKMDLLNRLITLKFPSNISPPQGNVFMFLLKSWLTPNGQDKPSLQLDLDNIIILT